MFDCAALLGMQVWHHAKLFKTIGSGRFVYGTQWPLRLTQNPRANLDLLPDDLRDSPLAGPADVLGRGN